MHLQPTAAETNMGDGRMRDQRSIFILSPGFANDQRSSWWRDVLRGVSLRGGIRELSAINCCTKPDGENRQEEMGKGDSLHQVAILSCY